MKITTIVEHLDPARPTIARVLAARLGREPTHRELVDDVRRILGKPSERVPANAPAGGLGQEMAEADR